MRLSITFKKNILLLLLGTVFLSSCATQPITGPDTEPAMRQKADLVPEGIDPAIEVSDPL